MNSKAGGESASAAKPIAGAGGFEGSLHYQDSKTFRGWAWDRRTPASAVDVDIYDGNTLLGTVTANANRPDLLNAGKGDGKHGFVFAIPASLRDGRLHSISARIHGTTFELKLAPDPFVFSSP